MVEKTVKLNVLVICLSRERFKEAAFKLVPQTVLKHE